MTTSATSDWISTVTDDGVRNDLASAAADGALSYGEALRVLTDTAADGHFTAAEFQALQTVAAHLNNGLAASSYVADLFIQLVQGNPANLAWHGGSTAAATLGNLRADSTVTQLNELIAKWFLGTDLPDPTMVPPSHRSVTQPHYSTVNGPLYGHTGAAAIVDVTQGALGDCVVCTGMIELVNNHPDLLRSMIVDNGNGSYGVRFYLQGNEVWVTVNQQLPTDAYGRQVYGHNGWLQDAALWVPLLEKAYVQLSETGMVGHPAVNSYENIDGNSASIVLPAFTNTRVTYYSTTAADWAGQKAMLVAALAEHRDVVLETARYAPHTYGRDGQIELVGWHAFAVLGYDAGTDKFIVRNPWGDSYPGQNWTAQFELSMDQLAAEGGHVAVAAAMSNPVVRLAGASHQLGLAATVAVAPLFGVFNPDALPVSRYLFHAAGSGAIDLHGATDLATAEQHAAGDVVIGAADLGRLQFVSPGAAGAAVLSIEALVGQQWSAASDIHWTFAGTSADTIVLPELLTTMRAGDSVALSSLFQLDGASDANVFYELFVPPDSGTLDLHGARNLWLDAKPGQYELNAADLRLVTYRAPATDGAVKLLINAYHGTGWGGFEDINIQVGAQDVAHALQNYANGQFARIGPVSDTSAAVFANLDGLRTLLRADRLGVIQVNDDVAQPHSVTGAQFDQYRGVFAAMRGNVSLQLTDAAPADAAMLGASLAGHVASAGFRGSAADVAANLDALQALAAAGKLTAIALSDDGPATLAVSIAQLGADGAALRLIAGDHRVVVQDTVAAVLSASAGPNGAATQHYTIADSADNVRAGLDGLQALAAAGKLDAITLTGAVQPELNVAISQLGRDADALAKLTGSYWLTASGAHVANVATLAAVYPHVSFGVSDSAAQLSAHMDMLESLASQGKVYFTILTDDGTAVLNLSAAQLTQYASLLPTICSPHQLNVPGVSAGEANFIVGENWFRQPQARFHALTDGGVVPHDANTVVGFRNAQMGGGHNAVVLDAARSHYALRVDGSGTLEIKNIAQGDADYNHSVTINGADYVIFGAANPAQAGTDGYYIANGTNAAVAEIYAAALGHRPELAQLEHGESVLAGGASRADLAATLISYNEFQFSYPAAANAPDHGGAADQAFVTALYQNALHRAPDPGGSNYWLGELANGASRADVLVSIAVSAEGEANIDAAPGHQDGWLIDTSKGGYADLATLVGVNAAQLPPTGLA